MRMSCSAMLGLSLTRRDQKASESLAPKLEALGYQHCLCGVPGHAGGQHTGSDSHARCWSMLCGQDCSGHMLPCCGILGKWLMLLCSFLQLHGP